MFSMLSGWLPRGTRVSTGRPTPGKWLALATILCLIGIRPAFCEPETDPPRIVAPPNSAKDRSTTETLRALSRSLRALRASIREKNEAIQSADDEGIRTALRQEIERVAQQIKDLERDFERIATGVESEGMGRPSDEDFNWHEELVQLISPVIQELKKMTERPRQLERLRSDILYFENQLASADRALANLGALKSNIRGEMDERSDDAKAGDEAAREVSEFNERLLELLAPVEARWNRTRTDIDNQLAVHRHRLDEIRNERESLLESTQNVLRMFFKSRGRNFLVAMTAFLLVLGSLRFLHRAIHRFSPFHRPERRTFYVRLGDVLYHILSAAGAVSAFLIALYATGDWLLLSFAIVFLFGLAWTAKEGLHRFWQQIQLLLNLGTVRENERMIHDGIPWRVMAMNIYVRLENPALSNGWVRLPLRELIHHRSRPYHPDEPWFPCEPGQWVRLADGAWGQVKTQSPDMVQLALRGAGIRTYRTSDFLDQSPINLSAGFRLRVVFGFDYAHQAIITTEIPEILQAHLRDGLHDSGYRESLRQLKVEVEGAGASSLDLVTLADFSGTVADRHNILIRAIQSLAIDACNERGWIIPFTQVTVHAGNVFRMETQTGSREAGTDATGSEATGTVAESSP